MSDTTLMEQGAAPVRAPGSWEGSAFASDTLCFVERLGEAIHADQVSAGFYEGRDIHDTYHNIAIVGLIHTELSEIVDALRKPGLMSEHVPEFSAESEEVGDALIRLLDYAAYRGIPLRDVVLAKLDYNRTRGERHGKIA